MKIDLLYCEWNRIILILKTKTNQAEVILNFHIFYVTLVTFANV